jgi:hypothetical protein
VTFDFPKTLLVLLVFLTFVGQAMASTIMSYHMMSMAGMKGQEQSQDMPMTDHSNHKMMSESDCDDSASEVCCVKTCSCFSGGCSSITTLMKYSGNSPIIDSSSKIPSYLLLEQSQQSTSLYRPPILS